MSWSPISLDELQSDMAESEARMDSALQKLWDTIRVNPAKWQLKPWGDQGGGFWVVGVFGTHVLWYNDIEDGFNISRYSQFGVIDEYWCNQQDLRDAVYPIQQVLGTGTLSE